MIFETNNSRLLLQRRIDQALSLMDGQRSLEMVRGDDRFGPFTAEETRKKVLAIYQDNDKFSAMKALLLDSQKLSQI